MHLLLSAATVALTLFAAWRHWTVMRFLRRPLPPQAEPPRLVSVIQPILSGDATLPQTLSHNVSAHSTYTREFVWLLDEDDAAGLQICRQLMADYADANVRLLCQPPPPQGVNPKTFKLARGLAAAQGDVICVLDDDTMLPDGGLEQCLPYLNQPGAGLVFGLPYQVNFSNLWSSLVALFVNSSSLLTYVPVAVLHQPVTINGMFYALRRPVLEGIGGFTGLAPILAADFANAQQGPAINNHHLRTNPVDIAQQMRRHYQRLSMPGCQRMQQLQHRFPSLGIKPRRRFIKQQQFRIMHQCGGKFQPLLHSHRIFFALTIANFFQPQIRQYFMSAPERLFSRHPGKFAG